MPRKNFFQETILQPGDDYSTFETAFENQYGDLPQGDVSLEISPTEDEQFKFCGELRDADGNGINIDGFESVQALKDWAAEQRITDIVVLDD